MLPSKRERRSKPQAAESDRLWALVSRLTDACRRRLYKRFVWGGREHAAGPSSPQDGVAKVHHLST